MRMEMAAVNVQPESETRVTVSEAYEKIIQAMMGSLDSIARESDQTGDDKEQLNATIMYIGKQRLYNCWQMDSSQTWWCRKHAPHVPHTAHQQAPCIGKVDQAR